MQQGWAARWPRSSKGRLAALWHVLGGAARPYKGFKVPRNRRKSFLGLEGAASEAARCSKAGHRVATVQLG